MRFNTGIGHPTVISRRRSLDRPYETPEVHVSGVLFGPHAQSPAVCADQSAAGVGDQASLVRKCIGCSTEDT